jgi:hypothetical protein
MVTAPGAWPRPLAVATFWFGRQAPDSPEVLSWRDLAGNDAGYPRGRPYPPALTRRRVPAEVGFPRSACRQSRIPRLAPMGHAKRGRPRRTVPRYSLPLAGPGREPSQGGITGCGRLGEFFAGAPRLPESSLGHVVCPPRQSPRASQCARGHARWHIFGYWPPWAWRPMSWATRPRQSGRAGALGGRGQAVQGLGDHFPV